MATKGNNAQFTYDFGIAIAQSTVVKLTRLAAVTLSLASAYYSLKKSAKEYVATLRENTLRFGGILSTMKAMEQAQERLIKGQSYFSVEDQLSGMNKLMSMGIDVGKNLEWINKAAHATGKSYAEFSGMIASAISGNASALADAGLMTQRATRMFDKYQANTVMRQKAIMNFLKSNKALQNAIENDFETIGDQVTRLKGIWRSFTQGIVGKPNDPASLYGQTTTAMKAIAESLAKHSVEIKRYAFFIGQTLGWTMRQIGHFAIWLGSKIKHSLDETWRLTEAYQEQTRSFIVWLEFWKLKFLDIIKGMHSRMREFFSNYGDELKTLGKLFLKFLFWKKVFTIGEAALHSIRIYSKALKGLIALQQKYYLLQLNSGIGKFPAMLQSFAILMPRVFRKAWVGIGKILAEFVTYFRYNMLRLGGLLMAIFKAPLRVATFLLNLIKNFPSILIAIGRALNTMWIALNATNPIGWIILAISSLAILYNNWKSFRIYVNGFFKFIWETLKMVYNIAVLIITALVVGVKKLWGGIKSFFKWIWNGLKSIGSWLKEWIWDPVATFFKNTFGWVADLWRALMNSAFVKWLKNNIIDPLSNLFSKWVSFFTKLANLFGKGNTAIAAATNAMARDNGLPALGVSGGNYNEEDSRNFLDPNNIFPNKGNENPIQTTTPTNPLLANSVANPITTESTNKETKINLNEGAVKIIVQKGENIDERKLALKIKEVINDLQREGKMRGGMI